MSTAQIQIPAARYPFSAIVGQEPLKEALLRLAVDPNIGGLLVSGTRGTAKSTAVRALADLLPPIPTDDGVTTPTPFVELPVGAVEDRVIGSLDVRLLLTEAERRFEPGLLARAHRGILYADEVNLLPDHLVDVILDAAASGVNVVERDGASFAHEARIMLVGTMNPEEGELRPQLLDRFGLCVAIENDDDIDRRVEIVERRMAFERDPLAFANSYESLCASLRERIVRARELLKHVALDRGCLRRAAQLAIEARVEGMRADITIVRTARAIAAFEDRTIVTLDDVDRAAHSALAHRRRDSPRDSPRGAPPRPPAAPAPPARPGGHESALKTFDVGAPLGLRLEAIARSEKKARLLSSFTARGHGSTQTPRGIARAVRTITARIDALATIRATAQDRTPGTRWTLLPIDARHMRFIKRYGRERRLVVFLIDASGSMAAAARMRAAKGAVCSLLENAYHRRDMIALLAFHGENAELLLPPTRSAALAYRLLRTLPTGGRTPLAAGLRTARELLATHARRDPAARAHLVIVSDARANAPELDAFQAALHEASLLLRTPHVRSLCIDVESNRVRLGNASRLAYALNATYQHLETCTERALGAAVRQWASSG